MKRLTVEALASFAVAVVMWVAGLLLAEPEQWQPFEAEMGE